MNSTTTEPLTVSVKTLAQLTGLNPRTISRRVNDGTLQSVKFGKNRLINYQSAKQALGVA